MKKLQPREWLIIIVPLLMMVGAWQMNRDSWLRGEVRKVSRQELYVESVQPLTLPPRDVQRGFDTRLRVVFNCTGWRRPGWWANPNYRFYSSGVPASFVIRNRNRDVFLPLADKHILPTIGGYNPTLDRYTSEYSLNLATLPRMAFDVTLHGKMWITDSKTQKQVVSNKATVSYLVRRANAIVRTPVVSRDTGLQLMNNYLRRYSDVEVRWFGYNGCVVYQAFIKRGTRTPKNATNSVEGIQLLDETGKIVKEYSPEAPFPPANTIKDNAIAIDTYIIEPTQFKLPKKLPRRLILRRVLALPGMWPIEYSVVIHDPAKGLDLRRIKPAPTDAGYGPKPKPYDVVLPFTQRKLPRDAKRTQVLPLQMYLKP